MVSLSKPGCKYPRGCVAAERSRPVAQSRSLVGVSCIFWIPLVLYFLENNAKPRSSHEDNSRGRRLGRLRGGGGGIKGEGNKRVVHRDVSSSERRTEVTHAPWDTPPCENQPLIGWALKEKKQDAWNTGELWVSIPFPPTGQRFSDFRCTEWSSLRFAFSRFG